MSTEASTNKLPEVPPNLRTLGQRLVYAHGEWTAQYNPNYTHIWNGVEAVRRLPDAKPESVTVIEDETALKFPTLPWVRYEERRPTKADADKFGRIVFFRHYDDGQIDAAASNWDFRNWNDPDKMFWLPASALPQPAQEDGERERFEAWLKTSRYVVGTDAFEISPKDGDYLKFDTSLAFAAWKAALKQEAKS